MKTLIAILAVATCCFAAEVAGPNLEEVHAKISERLKQEQGSQQGVYHVYLQDGRLQKVQYATAPITSGQQAQQQQAASNNNDQQQTPEILSPEFAERRGVYFVEVPQERIQALQGYRQQQTYQQGSQNFQASAPAQYNQEDSSPAFVRYLPLEDQPAAPSAQFNQEPAVPVVRYLPVPLTEDAAQYRASEQQVAVQYPEVQPREHQAIVQYSEVQPITGPVYSYSPEAITRVLRYAPVY